MGFFIQATKNSLLGAILANLIACGPMPSRAPSGPTPATYGLSPSANPAPKATNPEPRPGSLASHAVVISIDGLRPDMLLRSNTKNLHDLLRVASFTFWARTTALAKTLPSHVSMLTGVNPSMHGVLWNSDRSPANMSYPLYPTLLETAKQAGYSTAMAVSKPKLGALNRPGTVDRAFVPNDMVDDDTVATEAERLITEGPPGVLFVHFGATDIAGHTHGWGSPQQVEAIEHADGCVGRVIDALRRAGHLERTLIIVSADHGGQGRNHGSNDARSLHIPWIAAGPHVRKGYDLTVNADLQVNTEDTFATTLFMLGVQPSRPVEGKPVLQILDEDAPK